MVSTIDGAHPMFLVHLPLHAYLLHTKTPPSQPLQLVSITLNRQIFILRLCESCLVWNFVSLLTTLCNSRAPPVPEIEHTEDSTVSLIDVDSPHVSSVPSDFDVQSIKTDTQADRIEREVGCGIIRQIKPAKLTHTFRV